MSWDIKTNYAVHDELSIKGFFGEYRWLSNYHESPVFYGGVWFKSVEAAYQSAKCARKEDVAAFVNMTPSESKRAGKRVLIRPDWDSYKTTVMALCVLSKFMESPELREKLLATDERYLEETNHWNDVFWGVSSSTKQGKNTLGKILMGTRGLLKQIYG